VPFRFGDEFSKRGSVFAASIPEGIAASGAFDLCIEIEMLSQLDVKHLKQGAMIAAITTMLTAE